MSHFWLSLRSFDIFAVAERMAGRGWLSALTREPKGMHAMMSLLHDPAREDFLVDLRECVDLVRKAPESSSGLSAVY